ncbi:MAG: hypothetical protein N3D73_00255 [Candidatus Diapherotrites archaeon]|nr:hypothetical protein [Candidatus Diapherotrites archaeon]
MPSKRPDKNQKRLCKVLSLDVEEWREKNKEVIEALEKRGGHGRYCVDRIRQIIRMCAFDEANKILDDKLLTKQAIFLERYAARLADDLVKVKGLEKTESNFIHCYASVLKNFWHEMPEPLRNKIWQRIKEANY